MYEISHICFKHMHIQTQAKAHWIIIYKNLSKNIVHSNYLGGYFIFYKYFAYQHALIVSKINKYFFLVTQSRIIKVIAANIY